MKTQRLQQPEDRTDAKEAIDQNPLKDERELLPTIAISGVQYYIALRAHELSSEFLAHPVISLKKFAVTDGGENSVALYDPGFRTVFAIDSGADDTRTGMMLIKIPNEFKLDPIRAAEMQGMDKTEILQRFPIQQNLKAEIIPLDQIDLQVLIRDTRAYLKLQGEEPNRRIQPKNRPRF